MFDIITALQGFIRDVFGKNNAWIQTNDDYFSAIAMEWKSQGNARQELPPGRGDWILQEFVKIFYLSDWYY